MSRRSPRHWDGREVRKRQTTKVTCSGTGRTKHDPRLVGTLGWSRDDVNRQDPRWIPAGPVLLGSTGLIAAGGALMDCPLCPKREFLQPFEVAYLVKLLLADGVASLRLQDVAGKIATQ